MKKMGITEAFRCFGAKLKNINWSVSAENENGELVVSLWKHNFIENLDKTIRYRDKVH